MVAIVPEPFWFATFQAHLLSVDASLLLGQPGLGLAFAGDRGLNLSLALDDSPRANRASSANGHRSIRPLVYDRTSLVLWCFRVDRHEHWVAFLAR